MVEFASIVVEGSVIFQNALHVRGAYMSISQTEQLLENNFSTS